MVKVEADILKTMSGEGIPVHIQCRGIKDINRQETLMAIHCLIMLYAESHDITYDAAKVKAMCDILEVEQNYQGSHDAEEEFE